MTAVGGKKFNADLEDYFKKTDDTSEKVSTNNLHASNSYLDFVDANTVEVEDLTVTSANFTSATIDSATITGGTTSRG